MNIIDIIICAVVALALVSGMHKGFMGSLLALGGFIGAWFAAMQTYGMLAGAVLDNALITTTMQSVLSAVDLFKTEGLAEMTVGAASLNIDMVVQELNLPMISTVFQENVTTHAFESLGLNTLADYLTQTMVVSLINIVSFIVAFVVIYFAILLVVNLLNNVFRFPAFRRIDWLLGGLLGILRGVFIVFLIFAVMPTALSVLESMSIPMLTDLLNESKMAAFFMNTNFLSEIIKRLVL